MKLPVCFLPFLTCFGFVAAITVATRCYFQPLSQPPESKINSLIFSEAVAAGLPGNTEENLRRTKEHYLELAH